MRLSEKQRLGPLTQQKKIITIFHSKPNALASGGESVGGRAGSISNSANQELAVRGGAQTGDASTVEDKWEIRGDRVVRVINIPRCHTTVPSLEPEPCPTADDQLTCKRVTIV